MKLTKLKTYFTAPTKCFTLKCKAHCCTNAPLPEGFLQKHTNKIQREIYSGVNIGRNDPKDTFNSIIYNTSNNPIQFIGFDQHGNKLMGIPPEVIKKLQIKSMEQIDALMKSYNQFDNYCPFIKNNAKCSVYKERPQICREFGTLKDKQNICPEKTSRLDIIKYYIKDFFDFYTYPFRALKNIIYKKFSK